MSPWVSISLYSFVLIRSKILSLHFPHAAKIPKFISFLSDTEPVYSQTEGGIRYTKFNFNFQERPTGRGSAGLKRWAYCSCVFSKMNCHGTRRRKHVFSRFPKIPPKKISLFHLKYTIHVLTTPCPEIRNKRVRREEPHFIHPIPPWGQWPKNLCHIVISREKKSGWIWY